jgi:peptide/nickel transport system ATP-binding protein
MTALLSVRDLQVSFRAGKSARVPAVRGVGFDIAVDSTLALVGESGSGKTVTAMAIVGLLPDNAVIGAGSAIEYGGRDLLHQPAAELRRLRGRDISVVFQEPMSSLNPVLAVGGQIAEVLRLHTGLSRRQAYRRAIELLDEVGIPDPVPRAAAYPHQMSGGQQQRVMIAMAIACEPKLLIADEPTTALDVTVQRQILELLARLRERHRMSMLFISHDLALVGEVADRVVVMRDGVVREAAAVERIFTAPQDPYTRALLACRPGLQARPHRLPVIDDFLRPERPGAPPAAPRAARAERAPTDGHASALLEARDLRKEFRLRTGVFAQRTVEAVKDVSFTLRRGRTLGVVGESGSGKTTLALLVMRLLEATRGEVRFDGTDLLRLSERETMPFRRRIQIVFQNPYASLNPRFTVGHTLTEPMRVHRIGADDAERFERAAGLARRVGLDPGALHRYPHEFSGGQRQRIAIARCLALQPEVLICDESVSALDVSVQATVLNLLLDLQDEFGISYLFISHDLAVVRAMADEILVMHGGAVVEQGSAEAVYGAPQHDYTKKLLGAVARGYAARAA